MWCVIIISNSTKCQPGYYISDLLIHFSKQILNSINSIKTTTTKKNLKKKLFVKADMTKRLANNGVYLRLRYVMLYS